MAGTHQKPEPEPIPTRSPWYVWILLVPPPLIILFVLAGWVEHYRLALVAAGLTLSILSLVLQFRNDRVRRAGG
jgi:hypothetical protein